MNLWDLYILKAQQSVTAVLLKLDSNLLLFCYNFSVFGNQHYIVNKE